MSVSILPQLKFQKNGTSCMCICRPVFGDKLAEEVMQIRIKVKDVGVLDQMVKKLEEVRDK